MAITGIDTIEGKQIIAAGAVSAKSAEMAYNDENGNPITGYLTAVPEGYATTGDLNDLVTSISETYQPTAGMTAYQPAGDYYSASNPSGFISEVPTGTMNESAFGYDSDNKISSYNGSAIGGSTPTYGYTDNGLISAIDASGLYATSALEAESANVVKDHGTLGYDLSSYLTQNTSYFYWMPANSPWTTADYATGIFAPLQYATGACLAMNNPATFKSYYKGNEWFVSNTNNSVGQMLRGEVHKSRGVHISGATTAGYGFDLNISGVSGKNDTANGYNWQLQRGCVSGKGILGEWRYGPEEDAALRAVSSCDMHESAFGYDANDKISGYNGSAFAGGSDVPEGVMVESGLEYNAVNEISGYNGSAIAQYGAEKQWLVHDDTLVHASNSAQYALGVNLSAVAQLLGVDETVLWSGDTGSNSHTTAFTLSESFSSFKRIRFEGLQYANSTPIFEISTPNNLNSVGVCFEYYTFTNDGNPYQMRGGSYSATNGLDFTLYKEKFLYWSNTGLSANGGNNTAGPNIRRIVGIGRKQ